MRAALLVLIAACGDNLAASAPVCPAPVDAACPELAPCIVGPVPGPLFVGYSKTGVRPCWQRSGGIACPSEPNEPTPPTGWYVTADGWSMIVEHAEKWNAIADSVARCSL